MIAHNAIHDATRLLGFNARHVDEPGFTESTLDLGLCDGVECHSLGTHGVHAEHLREMPCDGLALPIQVRCKPHLAGRLGQTFELRDRFSLAFVDFVRWRKVVFEVHAGHGLLGALGCSAGKVADVSDRSLYDKARPEVLLDGLGLGWALHNDQLVAPSWCGCAG